MGRARASALLVAAMVAFSVAFVPAGVAAADAPAAPAPTGSGIADVVVDGPPNISWTGGAAVASVRYREIETPATRLPGADTLAPLIVGGDLLAIDQHRYATKVFTMDGPFSVGECGGVIVDPQWMLTAAHCTEVERTPGWFVPAEELAIVYGTADWTTYFHDYDGHLRFTSDVIVHPAYDRTSLTNDLALVRVDPAFDMVTADTIPLFDRGLLEDATPAYVLGWGATESGGDPVERLSGAPVTVDATCGFWPVAFAGWDHDQRLCASAPTAGFCQGDSGAPLVVEKGGVVMAAGLVSFNSTLGCAADPAYPDVYTRISTHVGWIEGVVGPLWQAGTVSGSTAMLTDARPGRVYAVQLFDDAGSLLYVGRVQMPGAMVPGPGETGVDCSRPLPHPFVDVDPASYAAVPIGCLWQLGITNGTGPDTFSPDEPVTREQIAAFAARFYETVGGSSCHGAHPFTDVSPASYANAAIGCVASLGITTGTGPGTYSPHEFVTREQMAAYVGRLYRAITGEACAAPAPFPDVGPWSYAAADVGCLAGLGITTGVAPDRFAPDEVLRREQLAAFFARLYVVLSA